MMEWWAYLADILTFYNERVANQNYLRTADLPESVTRMIKILGYRPQPGIGASGAVAALLSGPKGVSLAPVFAIQSKPGPGKQPQTFELNAPASLNPPDAIAADPIPNPALFAADGSILVKGVISSLKPGTPLLIVKKGWNGTDSNYALVTVTSTQPEPSPRGKPSTRVQLSVRQTAIPNAALAVDYQLQRSTQTAHVWQYPASIGLVVAASKVHMDSLVRSITAGQMMLFETPQTSSASTSPPSPKLVSVTNYGETSWYANPKSSANPAVAPDLPAIGIPILHSVLDFQPALSPSWDLFRTSVAIYYNWQSVGELVPAPATEFDGVTTTLGAVAPALFPQGNGQPIQIEDALGNGVAASGSVGQDRTLLTISALPVPAVKLKAPLKVLFNLLSVSRGKTVANEILGSGAASQANQEFVLAKSPLTYLLSGDSTSGGSYKSTLGIWVDGLEWKEAPSFFAQLPDARIFVTSEDEDQKTHVKFGDGINGSRLGSGVNNLVASYRYGSGKDSPAAGSLTVISQPQPGLKSIRNPVAVGGGDDPDPASKIRQYAPGSVLTFGRAVSGDDYEAIAAQTPGVARARVYWGWDDAEQRTMVSVYVGDDQSAKDAAEIALSAAADPNRPRRVLLATKIPIAISLTLEIAADRVPSDVVSQVTAALTDPDYGLLGVNTVRIGQSLYESQIYETCLNIAGTIAVHGLRFSANRGSGLVPESSFRYEPGEGGFFQIAVSDLIVSSQVVTNAG